MSVNNLDNLELQAKKKKNKLIIFVVVGIFAFMLISFVSYLLKIDNSKVYEKRRLDKLDGLEVIKNPEFKENWAIAIENRMKKQEERTREVIELVKNKQDSILSELKTIINENNKNMYAQLSLIKESEAAKFNELKSFFTKKLEEQNARIDQLEAIKETLNNNGVPPANNYGDNITIGDDLLPELTKQSDSNTTKEDSNETKKPMTEDEKVLEAIRKNPNLSEEDKINFTKSIEENKKAETSKEEKKEEPVKSKAIKSKKKKLVTVKIDTSFNQKLIQAKTEIDKNLNNEEELAYKTYHISTGFTQAYMITGAYAPAFQEGSMEPLPVLFETEGDILMANNVSGNIEKCFLLGSAKGNMNSQTADIKLVSISCLINGGKARIEGSISGWVIGENGTPGLQGEMLHKNGAWLARTFVSGFFETFSQALSGGQTKQINFGGTDTNTNSTTGTTGTTDAVNSNLLYAGASGISNVFSKLGDYYIKMAEQIFPVIEVKGGRTVNILLIGGEDLQVVENNKVDIGDMAEMSEKMELQKRQKEGKINSVNAFTKVVSGGNGDSSDTQETTTKGSKNNDDTTDMEDLEDIPEIVGGN